MKISYRWLHSFLPYNIPLPELEDLLTRIGLEVEGSHLYRFPRYDCAGLVIGEITQCTPHPNADRLHVLQVDIGQAHNLNIVCGDKTTKKGERIVIAPAGTRLHTEAKTTLVQKTRLRGIDSEGMACSAGELGLSNAHEEVLRVGGDIPAGTPLTTLYPPYEDTVLELGLTPNRTDCMSHWGVARALNAYLNYQRRQQNTLQAPPLLTPDKTRPTSFTINNDPAVCPRFCGVLIDNITVTESPDWLVRFLESMGGRSVNNIVDSTNFILHLYGQPVHAYDADKIPNAHLEVSALKEAAAFRGLDGQNYDLRPGDIAIKDKEHIYALAGIMGGLDTAVVPATKRIFLEIAHFDALSVRKTATRLGLRTEAALRFEKGTDPSACKEIMGYLLGFLKKTVPAFNASELIDIAVPAAPVRVSASYAYVQRLSGKNYTPEQIKSSLQALDYLIEQETDTHLSVRVPAYKQDVRHAQDLVEEIMRTDGFERILTPDTLQYAAPPPDEGQDYFYFKEKLLDSLAAQGFNEILSNSVLDATEIPDVQKSCLLHLSNPLSRLHNALRPHTVLSGLEAIAFNAKRQQKDFQFFEYAKHYQKTSAGSFTEKALLSLWISGNRYEAHWQQAPMPFTLFDMKSFAEQLFGRNNLNAYTCQPVSAPHPDLEEIWEYRTEGKSLGYIAAVSTALCQKKDIKQAVFFAAVDIETLYQSLQKQSVSYKTISKFPTVQRDLSLLLPRELPFAAVTQIIAGLELKELEKISVFDLFEPKDMQGKKSLAFSLFFSNAAKTFEDKEIDALMQRIQNALTAKEGIVLRR